MIINYSSSMSRADKEETSRNSKLQASTCSSDNSLRSHCANSLITPLASPKMSSKIEKIITRLQSKYDIPLFPANAALSNCDPGLLKASSTKLSSKPASLRLGISRPRIGQLPLIFYIMLPRRC